MFEKPDFGTHDTNASGAALIFPIHVIDFEASSLDDGSYPVEVGVAVWSASNEPIRGWGTLIRSHWHWSAHGRWSRRPEAIHGISREALEDGIEPRAAADALNDLLAGKTVFCDGNWFDRYWRGCLFVAAGVTPAFTLGDWREVLALLDGDGREQFELWNELKPTSHRARADAEGLLLSLAFALGVTPAPLLMDLGRP